MTSSTNISPEQLHRFDSVWSSFKFRLNSLKQALIIKKKHLWHTSYYTTNRPVSYSHHGSRSRM